MKKKLCIHCLGFALFPAKRTYHCGMKVLFLTTSVQLTRKIMEKPQGGSIHLWGRFFVIAGKPFLKFSMFEKYNGNF